MTITPRIDTVLMSARIASTAAPSAPFLSPRPTQRDAAMAAASVTLTSSMARLRSGAANAPAASVMDGDDSGRPPHLGRVMGGAIRHLLAFAADDNGPRPPRADGWGPN